MQASEAKLQPLIEGTKQFVVPLFQRSYSWTRKEWEVLWNDLVELCEMDTPRNHFFGSIVTMPSVSVPEGVTKYQLIDGQQRLTTVFLLLILLRDNARQHGQGELGEEIEKTLLVNQFKKDLDYYKLLPTQADRAALRELVRQETRGTTDKNARTRLEDAYSYFERKLRQKQLDIEKLKHVITNNLSIVSIVLDVDDNPYLVFEGLNAKGKPLSQSDLIRNYIFMRVHIEEQENIYDRYWKPMQDALGDSLTEFIRHYLMKGGEVVRQGDVYFALKNAVSTSNVLDYLRDIARFATYYEKLVNPFSESDVDIRRVLIRLNRIEVTTAFPFLLNCYEDYHSATMTREDFLDVLGFLENFMIRRFVCSVPTMGLNRMFPALYHQVRGTNGLSLVENLKNVLQRRGYPKDDEFKERLTSTKLYGVGERAVKTKLLLESIEDSFGHKETISPDKLSIEHVMPQTPTEWWQDHLGDDWETTHELFLHTLGNLTLTAYNSELSNDNYPSKREHLIQSHLEMNKYFAQKNQWKKEDIEERSAHVADMALAIWPYFGDAHAERAGQTRVTGTTPRTLWILGQNFTVHRWRDVLEKTMETIADLEPEKFEQIMRQFPRLIGRDKKRFRATRELNNGVYIETNLSAKAIQSFCMQAIETIELTGDDWKVEAA